MTQKYQKIMEKRLGKEKEKKHQETLKDKYNSLRSHYNKAMKENKRMKREIKTLERALKKTVDRIEKLVHDESVERVLRRLNDVEKEKEETSVSEDISDGEA